MRRRKIAGGDPVSKTLYHENAPSYHGRKINFCPFDRKCKHWETHGRHSGSSRVCICFFLIRSLRRLRVPKPNAPSKPTAEPPTPLSASAVKPGTTPWKKRLLRYRGVVRYASRHVFRLSQPSANCWEFSRRYWAIACRRSSPIACQSERSAQASASAPLSDPLYSVSVSPMSICTRRLLCSRFALAVMKGDY